MNMLRAGTTLTAFDAGAAAGLFCRCFVRIPPASALVELVQA